MTSSVYTSRVVLRYLTIGIGIAFLFWLPFEDTSEGIATIFAVSISTIIAIQYLNSRPVYHLNIIIHTLTGFLAGFIVTPLFLSLIAFKTGLHNHNFSDYSIDQIINIIQLSPYLIVSGALIGLGSGIWRYSQQRKAIPNKEANP
jgi:hypothetical protein